MAKENLQPEAEKEQLFLSPEEVAQLILNYQLTPQELRDFLSSINNLVIK